MSAEHFEAKKHALRQTQDGVVVSFTIHPSEIPKGLSLASLGTRYMVAVAEIGDDEKPAASSNGKTPEFDSGNVGSTPTAAAKTKRKFSDLSLPQQCAITCNDLRFQRYLKEFHDPSLVIGHHREDAQDFVRGFLGVTTRAELSTNHDAANTWRNLHSEYEQWLTTQQYADSVR